MHEIGRCLLDMNKHTEAMEYLEKALQIEKQISLARMKVWLMHEIGRCLLDMNMNKHTEAMEYLKKALRIKQWLDVDKDGSVAITMHEIGRCLLEYI